jgi:hypothetical protein
MPETGAFSAGAYLRPEDISTALSGREDRPCAELQRDKPVTPDGLGRLKPFGIGREQFKSG